MLNSKFVLSITLLLLALLPTAAIDRSRENHLGDTLTLVDISLRGNSNEYDGNTELNDRRQLWGSSSFGFSFTNIMFHLGVCPIYESCFTGESAENRTEGPKICPHCPKCDPIPPGPLGEVCRELSQRSANATTDGTEDGEDQPEGEETNYERTGGGSSQPSSSIFNRAWLMLAAAGSLLALVSLLVLKRDDQHLDDKAIPLDSDADTDQRQYHSLERSFGSVLEKLGLNSTSNSAAAAVEGVKGSVSARQGMLGLGVDVPPIYDSPDAAPSFISMENASSGSESLPSSVRHYASDPSSTPYAV